MKPFLRLLNQTSQRFWQLKTPILIGAVIFAAVLLLIQGFFEQQADDRIRRQLLMLGIPQERFEELDTRMEQGDQSAFDELVLEMEKVSREIEGMGEAKHNEFITQQSFRIAMEILPLSLLFLFIVGLVGVLSSTYFLIAAIDQVSKSFTIAIRAVKRFLPMLGLWAWVTLRSFIWIPVIGIFTGIYYLPRFVFSGVILLEEGKGIKESVRESEARTRASWLLVVGNMIGLLVCAWVAWFMISLIAAFLGPVSKLVMAIASQLILAFAAIFTVIFARRFSPALRE